MKRDEEMEWNGKRKQEEKLLSQPGIQTQTVWIRFVRIVKKHRQRLNADDANSR